MNRKADDLQIQAKGKRENREQAAKRETRGAIEKKLGEQKATKRTMRRQGSPTREVHGLSRVTPIAAHFVVVRRRAARQNQSGHGERIERERERSAKARQDNVG